MINKVSEIQTENYLVNTNNVNDQTFRAKKRSSKYDSFERVVNNPNKNVAKTSIIAGAVSSLLAFGVMFSSNKFSNKLWMMEDLNITWIPIPVIIGIATALATNLICNYAVSKNKK